MELRKIIFDVAVVAVAIKAIKIYGTVKELEGVAKTMKACSDAGYEKNVKVEVRL